MRASVVFLVFIFLGLYLFRVFNHNPSPVSFAKGIDDFSVQGVPNFELESCASPNGHFSKKISLKNYNDRVMLVNFWATWCAPCVEEFPALVKLASLHQKPGELQVFAISVDKDKSQVQKFISHQGSFPSNFHILIDLQGNFAHKYGTQKIPETYIIDSNYKLLRKALGDQSWLSQDFSDLLKKLNRKKVL